MQKGYATVLSKICVRQDWSKESPFLITLDSGAVVFVIEIVEHRVQIDFNGKELGWCTFFLENEDRFLLRHEKNQQKAGKCFDAQHQDLVNVYEQEFLDYKAHASGYENAKISNFKLTKNKLYSRVEKRKYERKWKINKIDNSGRKDYMFAEERLQYRTDIEELAENEFPNSTLYHRFCQRKNRLQKMYINNSETFSYTCKTLNIKPLPNKKIEFIQFVVEYGENFGDQLWRMTFLIACEIGHIYMIKFLRENIFDLNTIFGHDGKNGLVLACENSQFDVIKLLIEQYGFSINGKSILMIAHIQKDFQSLTYLFTKEFDDEERKKIFLLACEQNDYKMLNFYLKNFYISKKIQNSGFYEACLRGDFQLVKYFLKRVLKVKIKNSSACKKNYDTQLWVTNPPLPANSVDILINQWEKENMDEFESACVENKSLKIIQLLVQLKVNLKMKDYDGYNCFIRACIHDALPIVQLLYHPGMRYKTAAKGYNIACREGNFQIVQFLVNRCVYTEKKDEYGLTGFLNACILGHLEIVDFLVQTKRVYVNDTDQYGQTGFFYACMLGYFEIANVLLKHNHVNFEIKNEDGDTAFIYVCEHNHFEMVKLLFSSRKIDLEAEDRDEKTGFLLACEHHHVKIMNFLMQEADITFPERTEYFLYACKEVTNLDMIAILMEQGVDHQATLKNRTGFDYIYDNKISRKIYKKLKGMIQNHGDILKLLLQMWTEIDMNIIEIIMEFCGSPKRLEKCYLDIIEYRKKYYVTGGPCTTAPRRSPCYTSRIAYRPAYSYRRYYLKRSYTPPWAIVQRKQKWRKYKCNGYHNTKRIWRRKRWSKSRPPSSNEWRFTEFCRIFPKD